MQSFLLAPRVGPVHVGGGVAGCPDYSSLASCACKVLAPGGCGGARRRPAAQGMTPRARRHAGRGCLVDRQGALPRLQDLRRPLYLLLLRVFLILLLLVGGEEGERLHQLIALGHRDIGVVQAARGPAVHVEPPIALEDRLVKQRRLRAQKALHDKTVVCQRAHVEHLQQKGSGMFGGLSQERAP